MSDVLTAIGLMSGAALDGIDAAVLKTDGRDALELGPTLHVPYHRDLKIWIRRAMKAALEGRDGAADIGKAAGEVTLAHIEAVETLLEKADLKRANVDVIGFHGQTILHRPARGPEARGRSWQVGDGRVLAEETRIDVVCDFRSADVAAGGEGAPLAPVYYRALVQAHSGEESVGVLEIGDAVSLTFVPAGGREIDLLTFDCGPGVGFVEEWMGLKTGHGVGEDGAPTRQGKVHTEILRMMLLAPYLRRKPPKALDRFDFRLDPVLSLSTADGAATLTAFIAACVRANEKFLPDAPGEWIVCGEGRHNPTLMEALGKALSAPVRTAEDAGWRGDTLEAESIAYLAVRSLKKLPLTYPDTTRAAIPTRGGVFHRAPI